MREPARLKGSSKDGMRSDTSVDGVTRAHHVHSVAVDELLCCEPVEAVDELLFVQQEGLQPFVQGPTISHAVLVQFVQLPDH